MITSLLEVAFEHSCTHIRFWWSLLYEVDWWDAVGCTHSAVEDNLGKFLFKQLFLTIILEIETVFSKFLVVESIDSKLL